MILRKEWRDKKLKMKLAPRAALIFKPHHRLFLELPVAVEILGLTDL